MSAFAEKHYPEKLLPEELDAYLSRGWYRMGQTIFTTHFLCFGEKFYSAIWVRLDLAAHTYRKSQRKLLERSHQRFRISCQPATLTATKEILYRRYRAKFQGVLAPSLHESLLDGDHFNVFNTYEITIYDDQKLVALSYFDLGKESAASIMGVYDPDYASHSLGYLTLLLEMEFCSAQGLRYYYPGYVVPGYDRFDYKLRIGQVEYYDFASEQWLPSQGIDVMHTPLAHMTSQLHQLLPALEAHQIKGQLKYYPLFEANLFGFWNAPYFDYPILVALPREPGEKNFHLVVYDVRQEAYQLLRCSPFDDLQFYFNDNFTNMFDRQHYFMELVVVDTVLFMHPEAAVFAQHIHERRSKRRQR